MDALHRLQFHIMQDEIQERWHNFQQNVRMFFTRPPRSRVGISLAEASHESEGRVWVEVGSEGLRLRVTHLHPANPSVSEALKRKCAERREAQQLGKASSLLTGKLIYPPEDDKISLSSLEDYWFNHWQGPFITADNNQNSYSLPKLRRSYRKSKRSSRCSICQKKLVRTELEDSVESQCHEREGSVLAHMPSVKLDTRVLKDDFEEKSDDDISKNSVSDDALSRCSASDEHLTRMHRIVDNELRTCYSLFVDEAVSQDVVDATVSMDTSQKVADPSGNTRFLTPPLSPRQSRSCPCSPKLSARTYSPESISSSPKSRSFVGISKFSLSSSLLTIHRQASNSLVPEFFKFDSGKAESPGASKGDSQQNILRFEPRKLRHTLSDATQAAKEESGALSSPPDPEGFGSISFARSAVTESQSLPILKLSKMSMTYRGGIIISEENECFSTESVEDISEQGAAALPHSSSSPLPALNGQSADTFSDNSSCRKVLPDVVPQLESLENGGTPPSSQIEFQSGVINLGFDGFEESSDFSDDRDYLKDAPTPEVRVTVSAPAQASTVLVLPHPPPADASQTTTLEADESGCYVVKELKNDAEQLYFVDGSKRANLSEEELGGDQAPFCADLPQALRSAPKPHRPLLSSSSAESPPHGGDQCPSQPQQQQYNTFIEKDVMQEAREMVFWWRRKNLLAEEDSEFCLHETECKVKQKPLLMFLHGIGSSADVWNQQLWYFLSCGYEVVAPDLLGHGLSSAPRNPKYYSFALMLDYISLVFDLFVPSGRKCIVIGHNYGCALAVALARGRPISVVLIILASCGGPSPLVPHPKYENALNSTLTRILSPFISCGCLSRELLYTPRGKHYPVVASDDSGVPSTPRYVVEFTSLGQLWPEGDLAFHRRITIPSLLLYGMKDTDISFVEMCEMEKTIPRAFLELIPGAGHELMTDCPEEVCHAMHRFVRRWRHHI